MTLNKDDKVKFLRDARHGEWIKNQTGIVEKVLTRPKPWNKITIFLITIDDKTVWATSEDLVKDAQLTLF